MSKNELIPHVWIFNSNRRVYPPTPPGRRYPMGGPIYREHWEKHEVIGQTSRSWITRYGDKVPKSGGRGFALCPAEVEDDIWIHSNRHKISRAVGELRDAEMLRQISRLMNFSPEDTP